MWKHECHPKDVVCLLMVTWEKKNVTKKSAWLQHWELPSQQCGVLCSRSRYCGYRCPRAGNVWSFLCILNVVILMLIGVVVNGIWEVLPMCLLCIIGKVKKVKCTLVQALRLCTSRTAHRGSRGIAILFHDHGTRRGWGVSVTPRPLFTPGKTLVPIVQEAGWAPGPVWTGVENLATTGIQAPGRPARSQSLYRLSYPAHLYNWSNSFFVLVAQLFWRSIMLTLIYFVTCTCVHIPMSVCK